MKKTKKLGRLTLRDRGNLITAVDLLIGQVYLKMCGTIRGDLRSSDQRYITYLERLRKKL
jgi:hypothetical protein